MASRRRKAPDRWRAFFIEVGAIAIGILIALGLEQSVKALHERNEAREAREAIDAEMQENVNRVAYRQAQQQCIEARLGEITRMLADWAEGKAPPPGLVIGDPGAVPLVQQRWQATLNSGRFSRQSSQAQSEQAAFYTRLAVLDDVGRREHYDWSDLRALELGPGVVRADQRPGLVAALQRARTDASDTRQLGRQVLETARRAGLTPKPFQGAAIQGDTCRPIVRSAATAP